MAFSPAQIYLARHRASAIAIAAGALAASSVLIAPPHPEDGEDAQTYKLLMTKLQEDNWRLKDIQSTEKKIEAKGQMFDFYQDYVDAVLDAGESTGKAVQDEIVVTMMIWALDLTYWDRALVIAEHVFRFGLQLPQRFKRDAPTFVVEQIAETALPAAKLNEAFPVDVLQRVLVLAQPYDIVDIVQAKLRKALGYQLQRLAAQDSENGPAGMQKHALSAALEMYESAFRLSPKIGVTKEIEALKRQLKKLPAPAQDAPADISTESADGQSAGA